MKGQARQNDYEQHEQYKQLLLELAAASKNALADGTEENHKLFFDALNRVMQFEEETSLTINDLTGENVAGPIPAEKIPARENWLRPVFSPSRELLGQPILAAAAVFTVVIAIFVLVYLLRPAPVPPPVFVALALPPEEVSPTIVVLNTDGTANFTREGQAEQPLLPGTQLEVGDRITQGASLSVLCPDGSILSQASVSPDGTVNCPPVEPATTTITQTGVQEVSVQKGGIQNSTIPYLLSPRATLVRQPSVTLVWHSPSDVEQYTVILFANGEVVWSSEGQDAEISVQEGRALLELPVELQPEIAYTVEICAVFTDLRSGCTTDPGWADDANLAFYYYPLPVFDQIEQQFTEALDMPTALFARAIRLSQPIFQPSGGEPLGYYQEALDVLAQIPVNHPDSPLAQSPELYLLQGELYRRIALPLSAYAAYEQAGQRATPGTEAAALAALGQAATTPDSVDAVALYDEALDHYAAFLSEVSFEARFQNLCREIGDICLDLVRCQDRLDDCTGWFREE